jgi:hypothetical protein
MKRSKPPRCKFRLPSALVKAAIVEVVRNPDPLTVRAAIPAGRKAPAAAAIHISFVNAEVRKLLPWLRAPAARKATRKALLRLETAGVVRLYQIDTEDDRQRLRWVEPVELPDLEPPRGWQRRTCFRCALKPFGKCVSCGGSFCG